MRIVKILNNNIVLSKSEGEECIVTGKGIAFGKKNGQLINDENIEKIFRLSNQERERMITLLNEINKDVLMLTQKIIEEANRLYDKPLAEPIYIGLTDHIDYAIKRTKDDLNITNPLLYEIRLLYPREYKVGIHALEMIKSEFDVQLPKDEAGFIAMHIINNSMDEGISNVYEITKISKGIIDIVHYHFNIDFSEEELNYSRFLTHLKFFSQRILNKQSLNQVTDESMLKGLEEKFPKISECINKINIFLQHNYQHSISTDERVYLILHIARVLK